jgi:hypothetical protein
MGEHKKGGKLTAEDLLNAPGVNIELPGPEGEPITQLLFDQPGLVANCDCEPEEALAKVRQLLSGELQEVEFFNPHDGGKFYLMAEAGPHIIGVFRAYITDKVDPRRREGQRTIYVPMPGRPV